MSTILGNKFVKEFRPDLQGEAKLYFRYMDDIFRDIVKSQSDQKLDEINALHDSLIFTREREKNGSLSMLDMSINNKQGQLSSTWYYKPSDTGLILNYHALAPKRYKRAIVAGFVHIIYRAYSTCVVYIILCQHCKACYVGKQVGIYKVHLSRAGPVEAPGTHDRM